MRRTMQSTTCPAEQDSWKAGRFVRAQQHEEARAPALRIYHIACGRPIAYTHPCLGRPKERGAVQLRPLLTATPAMSRLRTNVLSVISR
jgi:hypothetical protein